MGKAAWQPCSGAWERPKLTTVGGLSSKGDMWSNPGSRSGGPTGESTTVMSQTSWYDAPSRTSVCLLVPRPLGGGGQCGRPE